MGKLDTIKNLVSMDSVKKVGAIIWKHRRGISKIAGVALKITGSVLAVKNAAVAVHDVEKAAENKGEQLTVPEKVAAVMPSMALPTALYATGVAINIASDVMAAKEIKKLGLENRDLVGQLADLATAYNTVNDISKTFKEKLGEQMPKQVEKINDIYEESVKTAAAEYSPRLEPIVSNPRNKSQYEEMYLRTGDADYKLVEYHESLTGRAFLACKKQIDDGIESAKAQMEYKGFVSANDIYQFWGIPATEIGENLVWRYYKDCLDYTVYAEDDGRVPYMILKFDNEPYYDDKREYWD